MGCGGSSEKGKHQPRSKRGTPVHATHITQRRSSSSIYSAYGTQASVQCHFCGKSIPEAEYNPHTVNCSERTVTCDNSWCRIIVKIGEKDRHTEECEKNRHVKCFKCSKGLIFSELASHDKECHPVSCPCGAVVIPRLLKYCPRKILKKEDTYMEGAYKLDKIRVEEEEVLKSAGTKRGGPLPCKFGDDSDADKALSRLYAQRVQTAWRWFRTKHMFEDMVFHLIHKEMELKKEGFALFKARDRRTFEETDSMVIPKRCRSTLQPYQQSAGVGAPSMHYFPTSAAQKLTVDVVERMMTELADGQLLPYAAAWFIFEETLKHLNTLPNVVKITPNSGGRVLEGGRWAQGGKTVVVGDVHGQLHDVFHIIYENGMPGPNVSYVFNGDFVDRGQQGVEILLVLYSLMLLEPKYVTMNRGNHEADYMSEEYGFDVEVTTKYDRNMFRLVQKTFCALPLATIVGNTTFIVHGGISRRGYVSIDDLLRINRFRQIPMPEPHQDEEDEIFQDLVWSDPRPQKGWRESDRGAGVEFGPDVTKAFLELNKLTQVIRAHEMYMGGYEEHHGGLVKTVFSASNYDGPDTNKGSYAVLLGDNSELSYYTWQMSMQECTLHELIPAQSPLIPMGTPAGNGATFKASFSEFDFLASHGVNKPRTLPLVRHPHRLQVLKNLRERIFLRRHRLMMYFTKLDASNKGTVWKTEWVEAMRNVLNFELPWFFVRSYIVKAESSGRINYVEFLSRYKNSVTDLFWTRWERETAWHLCEYVRGDSDLMSRLNTMCDGTDIVSYNDFCKFIRKIDSTLSDTQLFELFYHFDIECQGHLDAGRFVQTVMKPASDNASPAGIGTKRWDIDSLEQLQSMSINSHKQLERVFKAMSNQQHLLSLGQFIRGMGAISNGMRKPLSDELCQVLFKFMDVDCKGAVTYDEFFNAFAVHDTHRPMMTDNASFKSVTTDGSETAMKHYEEDLPPGIDFTTTLRSNYPIHR